ncbi:hypothetical protein [Streptomyces violascens]|nr:hypothetical protein [Streptomyces violascens]
MLLSACSSGHTGHHDTVSTRMPTVGASVSPGYQAANFKGALLDIGDAAKAFGGSWSAEPAVEEAPGEIADPDMCRPYVLPEHPGYADLNAHRNLDWGSAVSRRLTGHAAGAITVRTTVLSYVTPAAAAADDRRHQTWTKVCGTQHFGDLSHRAVVSPLQLVGVPGTHGLRAVVRTTDATAPAAVTQYELQATFMTAENIVVIHVTGNAVDLAGPRGEQQMTDLVKAVEGRMAEKAR